MKAKTQKFENVAWFKFYALEFLTCLSQLTTEISERSYSKSYSGLCRSNIGCFGNWFRKIVSFETAWRNSWPTRLSLSVLSLFWGVAGVLTLQICATVCHPIRYLPTLPCFRRFGSAALVLRFRFTQVTYWRNSYLGTLIRHLCWSSLEFSVRGISTHVCRPETYPAQMRGFFILAFRLEGALRENRFTRQPPSIENGKLHRHK